MAASVSLGLGPPSARAPRPPPAGRGRTRAPALAVGPGPAGSRPVSPWPPGHLQPRTPDGVPEVWIGWEGKRGASWKERRRQRERRRERARAGRVRTLAGDVGPRESRSSRVTA